MATSTLQDKIVNVIASDQEEILDFTRQLIAVPTENPPGKSYRECIELIKDKLDAIGLENTILVIPSNEKEIAYPRFCLLGFHGTGKRTLYFHGHYDVVPAADETQFKPHVKDGDLYGRGSADMKGGLAAMIYAVKALKTCRIQLNGRIGLVFVPDEETGGQQGSQYLARTGVLGKDGIGMLTPEPTSGVIWNANRGAISLLVTVKGKPAHVCLQHQGVNAFEQMLTVANALRELKDEVESQKTNFNVQPEDARRSILMLGGQSGGGKNFNTLPGECSFTIDRRINPEEDLETEKQRLFALLEKQSQNGIDLDIEILQEGKSASTNEDNPVAWILTKAVESITGREPSFEMCPGLLETRSYAQQGIPAFGYGPGLLTVSHGPDEQVKIENIYTSAAVYAMTAAQVLR